MPGTAHDARTAALLNGIAGRSIELCEGLRLVSGQAAMQVLPKPGVVVSPGEWVLTSGIGGLFPRGILVGQVARFHRRDSATVEIADLAPAVDFAAVSTVLVVTDFRAVP